MQGRSLPQGERGSVLLLEHCAALIPRAEQRPSAYVRLEEELGNELARLLVAALAVRRSARVGFAV